MKTLELQEMENYLGGQIDCSDEGKMAFLAGAFVGGAIFFGPLGACPALLGAGIMLKLAC